MRIRSFVVCLLLISALALPVQAAAVDGADVFITLNGDQACSDGAGVEIESGIIRIAEPGSYVLSGEYAGRVIVDAGDGSDVRLTLAGAKIACPSAPAIDARSGFLTIELAGETENHLSDGFDPREKKSGDGALYGKRDLTITGTGALRVTGNFYYGIQTGENLLIKGGEISVSAFSDGLRGKDSVTIAGGALTIASGEDGIHASSSKGADKGFIHISGGAVEIDAGDDALHANGELTVTGGVLKLSAVKNGARSKAAVRISGGALQIGPCREGIEGVSVTIDGGDIDVTSSDNGINASSNELDKHEKDENCFIAVNGGSVTVRAGGDGLDSNGDIVINGGALDLTTTSYDEYALDANGEVFILGGAVKTNDGSENGSGADRK